MEKLAIEIAEISALCFIAFLIVVGNIFIIIAFKVGTRSIRNFQNYFIVNLAIADLTIGCISVPLWIVIRIDESLIRPSIYSVFIALDILCGTCSILNLAAISLERMFAVNFPTKHFNLKKRPVLCAIIGTWVYSITFAALKFIVEARVYTMSIFILAFVIPLIVIVICYITILKKALQKIRPTNQIGKLSKDIRGAKTIFLIIGLFVLCWLPFFVINVVFVFCTECRSNFSTWVLNSTKMIHYSNSMMNFFVYAVRSPDFRRSFKRILFKCCKPFRGNK